MEVAGEPCRAHRSSPPLPPAAPCPAHLLLWAVFVSWLALATSWRISSSHSTAPGSLVLWKMEREEPSWSPWFPGPAAQGNPTAGWHWEPRRQQSPRPASRPAKGWPVLSGTAALGRFLPSCFQACPTSPQLGHGIPSTLLHLPQYPQLTALPLCLSHVQREPTLETPPPCPTPHYSTSYLLRPI